MIKRTLLLTSILLIVLMGSMVFADDTEIMIERPTDEVLKASFEVFEPTISVDGTLNVRDHLYISIKINEEYPILMDLYKIEETLPELEALKEEASEEPVNVPVVLITPQETEDTQLILDVTEEEPVEEVSEPTETIEATEILDIATPVVEEVEASEEIEEELTRVQIINTYFELETKRNEALSALIIAEEAYLGYIATLSEIDEVMETSDIVLNYEEAKTTFRAVIVEFDAAAVQYNKLFETPVMETATLTKTGVLPYFKMSIDTIYDGDYKLAFTYEGDENAFEIIDFEVVTQSLVTEDAIATDISEILNELKDVEVTE